MTTQTKFRHFLNDMSEEQLQDFAARCGTTPAYLMVQLRRAYKVPRRDFMAALVLNSGGRLSRDDLLDHFYPESLFDCAA